MAQVISSEDDWRAFMARNHTEPVVAMTLQTTGPDPLKDTIQTLQLATATEETILDVQAVGGTDRLCSLLQPLLAGARCVKAFHDAKTSLRYLLAAGLVPTRIFDSMLADQLLSAGEMTHPPTLQESAHRHLGVELRYPAHPADHRALLAQVRAVYDLRLRLVPILVKARLVRCAQIEFECAVVTAAMEQTGIRLDTGALQEIVYRGRQRMAQATVQFSRAFGNAQDALFDEPVVSLSADQQVLAFLQQHGVPVQRLSRSALRPLIPSFPALQYLLEYRQASADRALESYLEAVHPVSHRIHPTYSQLAAATGRYGCSNPNMQSFPRSLEHRACIVPAPGYRFVIADYSQIELRIVAQISQDRRMLHAFGRGADLHILTASILTDKPPKSVSPLERQAAKAVNFGLIYAMGTRGLAAYAQQTYGVEMSLEEAAKFRQRFFAAYTGVARWHHQTKKTRPQLVRTLSGRMRRVPPGQLTQALNSPVQGTGADILKRALVLLFPALRVMGASIVGVVHDEILVEAPKAQAHAVCQTINEKMAQAAREFLPDVPCPVQARIAASWAEGE